MSCESCKPSGLAKLTVKSYKCPKIYTFYSAVDKNIQLIIENERKKHETFQVDKIIPFPFFSSK